MSNLNITQHHLPIGQPGVGGPSYRVLDIIGTGGFISDHTFPPVDLEYDTGWGFSTGRISVHSGFG